MSSLHRASNVIEPRLLQLYWNFTTTIITSNGSKKQHYKDKKEKKDKKPLITYLGREWVVLPLIQYGEPPLFRCI